jgi:hypothetical protein
MGATLSGYGHLSENKMAHHTTTTTVTIFWPTHGQWLEHMAQRTTTNSMEWEASATSHPRKNGHGILDKKNALPKQTTQPGTLYTKHSPPPTYTRNYGYQNG